MESEREYRPNTCLLIMNSEQKLFLGERYGEPGVWQLPQGGMEPEYTEEENALREAAEELGADEDCFSTIMKLDATHQYDFPIVPEYAEGRWHGQRQSFWLLEFRGGDSDIQLDRHHQEFSDWKWCTLVEVLELSEPRRVPGYREPVAEVNDFIRQNF